MKILNLNLFDALSLFEVKSSSHKKNISCCLKDHNLNKNFWKNKIYVKLIFQLQIRLNPRHSNFRSPCRPKVLKLKLLFVVTLMWKRSETAKKSSVNVVPFKFIFLLWNNEKFIEFLKCIVQNLLEGNSIYRWFLAVSDLFHIISR